jgi:hypothetical protein
VRINWKLLATDALVCVTFPVWILPVLSCYGILLLVEGFIARYKDPK